MMPVSHSAGMPARKLKAHRPRLALFGVGHCCDLSGLGYGLGVCKRLGPARPQACAAGTAPSLLAALGRRSAGDALASPRSASRALASRRFPLGLARSGWRPRRLRPRAGLWRPAPSRLCAVTSRASSRAPAPTRVSPRRLTSFLPRRDGSTLAAPGGGSGLVTTMARFGPAGARSRRGRAARASRTARARDPSLLAHFGAKPRRCGLLPHLKMYSNKYQQRRLCLHSPAWSGTVCA